MTKNVVYYSELGYNTPVCSGAGKWDPVISYVLEEY